jgi:tetratricopeptide (TPR) repeat protein
MSAVLPLLRRTWFRATLALAAVTTVAVFTGWCTARDNVAIPGHPLSPSQPAWSSSLGPTPGPTGGTAPHTAPFAASPFTTAFERGLAAYNADDPDAAADAFEEAVRLAPSNAEAHINLGLVYLRLRRADDGLRELGEGARLEQRPEQAPAEAGGDATIRKRARPDPAEPVIHP